MFTVLIAEKQHIDAIKQDNQLYFDIESDTSIAEGTAEIKGANAEGSIFETYTFKIDGNTVSFSSTDEEFKNGKYTKEPIKTQYDTGSGYIYEIKVNDEIRQNIYQSSKMNKLLDAAQFRGGFYKIAL